MNLFKFCFQTFILFFMINFFLMTAWSFLIPQNRNKPQLSLLSPISPPVEVNFKFRLKSIDVESGSSLHLHCRGDYPLIWKYPENIIDESYSIQDLFQVKSNCLSTTFNDDHQTTSQLCTSDFFLLNATFEQTGVYTCYYNYSVNVSDSLYIFINDKDYLLVPYEGNPYFVLISVIQSHPAVIPCLPTNSHTKVQLWKSHAEGGPVEIKVGNETGVSYDPTQGFYFQHPKWDIESSYLECRAELNGLVDKLIINIHWSIDPIYGIKPFIDNSETTHVFINSSFSLNCLVHLELGILINIAWNYPSHDQQRIIELDPMTSKTGVGSHQMEIVSRQLKVTNVQIEDEGYYFCNVTDARGRLYSASTYITVYNQSVPSSVTFSMDLNKTQFVRNFKDSLQLVVNVHAIPNLNLVSLTWYKDDEELGDAKGWNKFQKDSRHYQIYLERSQAILKIDQLEMKDSGFYILVGNTTDMTSNITIMLQVKGPPEIEILGTHRYYSVSQSYTLTCVATATPIPVIKWEIMNCQNKGCFLNDKKTWSDIENGYNNETIFEDKLFHLPNHMTSLSLKLTANQSKFYRCIGQNINGSSFQEIKFLVTDAGEEGFSLQSSPSDIVETDDVILTCKASFNKYTRLNWYWSNINEEKNLEKISNTTDKILIVEQKSNHTLTSVLYLSNVNLNDSGIYFCNATQRDAQFKSSSHTSKKIHLKVQKMKKPKIIKTNMKDKLIKVWPSNMSEFYCYASGKPKPIISWFKNGKAFNTTGLNGVDLIDDKQKLIIRRLVAYDSGKYQCQVTNKAGSINFYSTLKVLDKNENELNLPSILAIITFLIVAMMIVFTAFFIGQKIRKDRENEIEFFTKNLFNRSQLSLINPNTPLDEQVDLLAYDQRWEFPDNRIKFIRTLGEGAFGRVVLAEAIGIGEGGTSELVAVKMLKANSNCSQKKALIDELKILIHLGRHLNIVNCLGAVTKNLEKGKLMVIVEYCCFGNLRQYLYEHRDTFMDQVNVFTGEIDKSISKNSCLTVEIVNNPCYQNNNVDKSFSYVNWKNVNSNYLIKWNEQLGYRGKLENCKNVQVSTCDLICCAFQVARGMEYLEQKKLIHRDLAARNVLVAEKGVVKICDFGLAKNIHYDDNYVNKSDGLLPIKWMAIESIDSQVFTIKSDVWSFGVLLWEIFTLGSNPYPGIEANKQFYELLKNGYRMEKPSFCPNSIYEITKNCWKVNPSSRPSFTELAEKFSLMIEANVRNYYVELNNTYQQTNKMLKENENYIEMNGKSSSKEYQYVNINSSNSNLENKLDPMANYDLVNSTKSFEKSSCNFKVPMEVVPLIHFESYSDKRVKNSSLNINSSCLPNYNLVNVDHNLSKYSKNVTCNV